MIIVFSTWPLVYEKVSVLDYISNQIIVHIHILASSLIYCFIYDPGSALVIYLDRNLWLRMTRVGEDYANEFYFLYVMEERSDLYFCVQGEYLSHKYEENEDGSINGGMGGGELSWLVRGGRRGGKEEVVTCP